MCFSELSSRIVCGRLAFFSGDKEVQLGHCLLLHRALSRCHDGTVPVPGAPAHPTPQEREGRLEEQFGITGTPAAYELYQLPID